MKAHLMGWQWMLLLEGLPTSLLGIICFVYLPDRPSQAVWLNAEEKAFLAIDGATGMSGMEDPVAQSGSRYHVSTAFELFQNRQVWVLAFVYFAIACANYTFTFWLPTMLSAAGVRSIASIG